MKKRRNKARNPRGLQAVTLCISTALVLILLGMVVLSVLTAQNLSSYVKENLTVTVMLNEEVTNPEAQQFCRELKSRRYVNTLTYVSKEQVLEEQKVALGIDPSEFVNGQNPYLASVELQLHADYANSDSLKWISAEIKKDAKVNEIEYPQDLIDSVNHNLGKFNMVLICLAVLLSIVSFALINNSVKLGIYARRFTIHTMKLVGASWSFIRWPFLRRSLGIGFISAVIAIAVLGGGIYLLYTYEPEVISVITIESMAITATAVLVFGLLITFFCSYVSVNKFLRMKAGELYKI